MPNEAAADVVADPGHVLRRVLGFIGDPAGTDVANPLGSHGRVATALALLGARVTVFDLSESNARFARELASAAGVEIDYLVGDFERTARRCEKRFDAVVMELGIVHYFIDLSAFVASVRALMRPGGRVLLNHDRATRRAPVAGVRAASGHVHVDRGGRARVAGSAHPIPPPSIAVLLLETKSG